MYHGLTQVEELLIAAAAPMSVYRLPHGEYQYGDSGHYLKMCHHLLRDYLELPVHLT